MEENLVAIGSHCHNLSCVHGVPQISQTILSGNMLTALLYSFSSLPSILIGL